MGYGLKIYEWKNNKLSVAHQRILENRSTLQFLLWTNSENTEMIGALGSIINNQEDA